jgi:hypothetical protein
MREEHRRRVLGESHRPYRRRFASSEGRLCPLPVISAYDLHKKSLRMQVWGFQNILGSSNI